LPWVNAPAWKVSPFHVALRPVIWALAVPVRLSCVARVKVPAVVPQFVRPDSTPPFWAKLLAAEDDDEEEDELLEELLEDELLEDELLDDELLDEELLEDELPDVLQSAPVSTGTCAEAAPFVP
jgi:hypothetical protein